MAARISTVDHQAMNPMTKVILFSAPETLRIFRTNSYAPVVGHISGLQHDEPCAPFERRDLLAGKVHQSAPGLIGRPPDSCSRSRAWRRCFRHRGSSADSTDAS